MLFRAASFREERNSVSQSVRDVRLAGAALHFLPIATRVPLKFGGETLTTALCARARLMVRGRKGDLAEGWGETPLSVQWAWPSSIPFGVRLEAMKEMTRRLARAWAEFDAWGHPVELGWDFQEVELKRVWREWNEVRPDAERMPWLAALICCSVFDQALHDAYARLHEVTAYSIYSQDWITRDLSHFLQPAPAVKVRFAGRFPEDFLVRPARKQIRAWHLVGGLDPIDATELTGQEPEDGYPVLLEDWIQRDGLKCLKIKLRGNDEGWDFERVVRVGELAAQYGVEWLTADFNCTVHAAAYVDRILDRLRDEHPRTFASLLYVEQPFPYDLEESAIDAHSVSARKPLFLDESAHDWRLVRLGRELGWTGVALKTCKTQSGALLSACWAKAHGMTLMVQDLTNPMLAQIPHVLLAAHVGTIMGVETNAMQFYPEASAPEAQVHPGLYRRRDGHVDWSTLGPVGFGYREAEIARTLPQPEVAHGVL